MARVLGQVGFRATKLLNGTRDQMMREMLAFSRAIRNPNTVGLFYFAGHGVQLNGLNYLVPIDADINSEDETRLQSVDLSDLLHTMNAAGRDGGLNLVVLDACRNNPFARGWRSASRGLAAPADSPSGTLIAFATSPGEVAYDGREGNSPYTQGLAQTILRPGLSIEQTFKATRIFVQAATAKEARPQVPWETTSLTGDFYFIAKGDPAPVAALSAKTPGGKVAALPAVPDAGNRPIAPSNEAVPAAGCVVVGNRLNRPIPIRVGTQLCSANGQARATIHDITSYSIIYSVPGGARVTCRKTELCSFSWDGAPLFRINIEGPDNARSAELLPS